MFLEARIMSSFSCHIACVTMEVKHSHARKLDKHMHTVRAVILKVELYTRMFKYTILCCVIYWN